MARTNPVPSLGAVQGQVNQAGMGGTVTPLSNRPALGDIGSNQQSGNAGPGNAWLNALQSMFGAQIGPQDAAANSQIAGLQNQQLVGQEQGQLSAQDLQQQLASALGGYGLQSQSLGVQQGALQREMGFLPQLESLSNQSSALQGQSLADQLTAMQRYYPQQVRGFQGSQAAQGATNTQGTTQGLGNMAFDYSQQLASNQRSKQQLGIQQQQSNIGFQEQAGSLQDQSKNLSIAAKQLGLSETDTRNRINNALQSLGLQTKLSSDDITNAIAQVQAGQFSNLSPILSMVFGLVGAGNTGTTGG